MKTQKQLIRNYALYKNGSTPREWEVTEDPDKPRYGRLLFIKKNRVLLIQKAGKPWKLPGQLLRRAVDQEEALAKWSRDFLGISTDRFDKPLGLFTVGIRYANEISYRYRETLVQIPAKWRQLDLGRSRNFKIHWHPIGGFLRDTSFATRDYIKNFQERSPGRSLTYNCPQPS